MTEWLAGKKDEYNIQYAMHLGDIVDASSDAFQWDTAVNAMKTLQDGGIKYSDQV